MGPKQQVSEQDGDLSSSVSGVRFELAGTAHIEHHFWCVRKHAAAATQLRCQGRSTCVALYAVVALSSFDALLPASLMPAAAVLSETAAVTAGAFFFFLSSRLRGRK